MNFIWNIAAWNLQAIQTSRRTSPALLFMIQCKINVRSSGSGKLKWTNLLQIVYLSWDQLNSGQLRLLTQYCHDVKMLNSIRSITRIVNKYRDLKTNIFFIFPMSFYINIKRFSWLWWPVIKFSYGWIR